MARKMAGLVLSSSLSKRRASPRAAPISPAQGDFGPAGLYGSKVYCVIILLFEILV